MKPKVHAMVEVGVHDLGFEPTHSNLSTQATQHDNDRKKIGKNQDILNTGNVS